MAKGMLDLGVRKAVIIHCVERVVWVGINGEAFVIEIEPLCPEEIANNLGAGDGNTMTLLRVYMKIEVPNVQSNWAMLQLKHP